MVIRCLENTSDRTGVPPKVFMLRILTGKIAQSARMQELIRRIDAEQPAAISGVVGSAQSVVASIVAAHILPRRKNLLIIVPDAQSFAVAWDDLAALMKNESRDADRESDALVCFPEEERLPFDDREVSANLLALRQECIERLVSGPPAVVLTTIRSLMKRLPAPDSIRSYELRLQSGEKFRFDDLRGLLIELGYEKDDVVSQVGTFAIRGGILDIYPFSAKDPVRLEFDGDTVASLRAFDVVHQRSIESVDRLTLYPRTQHAHGEVTGTDGCLLDYFRRGDVVLEWEPVLIESSLQTYLALIMERFDECRNNQAPTVSSPEQRFLSMEEWLAKIGQHIRVQMVRLSRSAFDTWSMDNTAIPSFNGHLDMLRDYLRKQANAKSTMILCSNAGQVERLNDLLDSDDIQSGVDYVIGEGDLHEGFVWPDPPVTVLTDHQIFGRTKRPRVHKKFKSAQALRHIHAFKPGDFVVHVDHGIAQYAGLEKVTSGEHTEECLKLHYAGGDKLYVPLEHFARVQKFSAEEGVAPKLNKLGSAEWAKVKTRTKNSIKDIAQDLIKLYAERKSKQGFAFDEDTHFQFQMEASFEFEDTPDQTNVTAEIKRDMEASTPMDRLVCGDVGFGKTEVAIRAAFKCVLNNKQVAVLVPTTILADQHFETFSERLREFAVRVDVISRFRTPKEQKAVLEKAARGDVDILIGTHRLLSKDVAFKDLGLLVIDEEQRFGVTHKEKLRQMRATVDTLTLTATPIPRTLNFSLMGGRDLSIINTPPQNRLPIKTEITQFDEALIRHAITQELDRGGQVYVVHNRIQSIDRVAETIRQIVPRARYAIVHGQMPPSKIENVLHDFMKKKYDVLVATAIIENGIDIPNVNTILVDQAHHFGMAQLYQLRGRVGRSDKQAYCYLMTPPFNILASDALRKLQAIEEFTELGSGFLIAMRDLEIRGAGNILGAEQSGYINAIGFELYVQILEEAVAEVREAQDVAVPAQAIRRQQAPKKDIHVEVFCDTFIPEHYVNVQSERIRIYKEFSEAWTLEALKDIARELVDRFGIMPDEVRHLFLTMEIKIRALEFGFERIVVDENSFVLRFESELANSKASADVLKLKLHQVLSQSNNLRLRPERSHVDIAVGFPWYDVVKGRELFPVCGAPSDILSKVVDFLRKLNQSSSQSKETSRYETNSLEYHS